MSWSEPLGDSMKRVRVFALLCGVAACAQLPQSMAELGWTDRWGDRGEGVLARDYQMCTELVEQRRGLLLGCMQARGWQH